MTSYDDQIKVHGHPWPLASGWRTEVDEDSTWRYFWGDECKGVVVTFRRAIGPENMRQLRIYLAGEVHVFVRGKKLRHRKRWEVWPMDFVYLEELAARLCAGSSA